MRYMLFDTAECYTGVYKDGTVTCNENVVGKALQFVCDKVMIATKFGVQHGNGHLLVDSKLETIDKREEQLKIIVRWIGDKKLSDLLPDCLQELLLP